MISSSYADFIIKARNCKSFECGADDRYIIALQELEAESIHDELYQARLDQVKQFVLMALVVGIMKNLKPEDEEIFYRLMVKVDSATTSIPILEACTIGHDILQKKITHKPINVQEEVS